MKVLKSGVMAFSHAAALDRDGRLSNTVYCLGKDVFILNQDNSVIIKFQFPNIEFESPISFRSEDYDSNEIFERGGKVVFVRSNDQFKREKSCKVPGRSPSEVRMIWRKLKLPSGPKVALPSSLLELLDQSLSHIEMTVQNSKLFIIQKNIYTGTTITVTKKQSKGYFSSVSSDNLKETEYGPIGMRTGDLSALFSFCDNLEFTFPEKLSDGYFYINGPKAPGLPSNLQAFVCLCTYDELGDIQYLLKSEEEDNNGGQV